MKAKELQAENEALQAKILSLATNLKTAEEKIQFLETEIQTIFKQKQELKSELDHYLMLNNTSNKNQNDSRYY